MTTFPALQPYIDRGMLLSLLLQDALDEATASLGQFRWDVDVPAGTLTFTSEQDPNRRLVTRASMVASIAPGPRSLLWDWAHPQGRGDASVTTRLRDRGREDGVAELSKGEVPFPAEFEPTPDAVAALAHELGAATAGITGLGPYYSAPVEGGSRFLFLLETPLPPLTLGTAMSKLPRMLSTGLLRDARTSIWGLATLQGWNFQWTDGSFTGASITDGSSTAQFTFDQGGRITNVTGTASA